MSQLRQALSARSTRAWILAILLALASSTAVPAATAAPATPEVRKPVLVLLPIRVHSAENPVYLQEGLSDMLMARFRQGGVFDLKEVKDPSLSTTEVNEAVEAARAANGDFVLFGSFTRFGAGASLDMQAATTVPGTPGDSMREIFVHSGSIAEVIPDLDELVGKVTQFATTEYPGVLGDAEGSDTPPSEMDQLRQRVADLEAQLQTLQSPAATAAAGPTR